MKPREKLANMINDFLIKHGIEPIYFVAIISLIVLISYRKEIDRWDELENWRKLLIMSTAFGALFLSILSVLIYFDFVS